MRIGISLMVAGVIVLAVYAFLVATHIGGFGEPSDIGGGLIPLIGIGALISGCAVAIANVSEDDER